MQEATGNWNKYWHNPDTNTRDSASWYIFENMGDMENIKISQLTQALQYLYCYIEEEIDWTQKVIWGSDFSDYHLKTKSKTMQSSSWAWLYTITQQDWKDVLIKIWKWDFNTEVFTTPSIAEFKQLRLSSLPLFVIDQCDCFKIDEAEDIIVPRKCLNEHAVIVSNKIWQADFRTSRDRINWKNINFWDMEINDIDDTLAKARLAILHKEFSEDKFDDCLKAITELQTYTKFTDFRNNVLTQIQHKSAKVQKVLSCFSNMWTNVFNRNPDLFLFELVRKFDVKKQEFTSKKNK